MQMVEPDAEAVEARLLAGEMACACGGELRPIDTYQHVLPGMQADAARVFERLIRPGALPGEPSRENTREKRRRKTA